MQRWSEGHQSDCILPVHEENNGHSEMSHPVLTLPKQCENAERGINTQVGAKVGEAVGVCLCAFPIQTVSKGGLLKTQRGHRWISVSRQR